MHVTYLTKTALPLALSALLLAGGCKSNAPANAPGNAPAPQQGQAAPNPAGQQAMNPEAAPPQQPSQQAPRRSAQAYPEQQPQQPRYAPPPRPQAPSVSDIPAGTHIVVTLGQTISSKSSNPGDRFEAAVAEPVVVRGVTLVRAGSTASGTVIDAKAQGRFKGQAVLSIRLDTVRAEGRTYQVASSTIDRVEQGKGKRTAVLTGGGAGLGGLIGALAGGGKGALIGGLAGAGAGGAGSAFTGNKDLVIPAETRLTFRLERSVPLQ